LVLWISSLTQNSHRSSLNEKNKCNPSESAAKWERFED
jgi:hypothetical protein